MYKRQLYIYHGKKLQNSLYFLYNRTKSFILFKTTVNLHSFKTLVFIRSVAFSFIYVVCCFFSGLSSEMDQSGSPSTSVQRKVIHSQSRKIIYNVYKFMKSEGKETSERKLQERVAQACGVSLSSVFRIIKEASAYTGDTKSFSTPHKKRPRKKVKTDIDDFDKCTIRRIIHDCHTTEGERPTLKVILRILRERINYNGSVSSLRQIIRQMGFRWKRAENNRKLLIEKHDIINLRVDFIRKIQQYRGCLLYTSSWPFQVTPQTLL